MQLSEHFSFNELTTTSKTELLEANRKDAQANKVILKNLKYTAGALEEIRAVLGVSLKVSSGYRNSALNKAVKGSPTSKHMQGLCADVIPNGMTVQEAFKKLTENKDKLHSVRKVIIEGTGASAWLHTQSRTPTDVKDAMEFYSSIDGKTFNKVS